MPPTFNSLADLFSALPGAIDRALEKAAPRIGFLIEQRAQRKLGTYQPGWAPLSDWALETNTAGTPLLITGELRDSIQGAVDAHPGGYTVVVGSSAPQARIQELGGDTGIGTYIPPRPYLAPALVESEDDIQNAVAALVADEIRKL